MKTSTLPDVAAAATSLERRSSSATSAPKRAPDAGIACAWVDEWSQGRGRTP